MQSRPQMIVLASFCVLIAVNCVHAISSDSLLIKRVLAANQPSADASAGSSVSGDTDTRTVLRVQVAEHHRARRANGSGLPRFEDGSSTTTSTSTPDSMGGNPPSVDHAMSSNRKLRLRRSPFPYGWLAMSCAPGEVDVGGKCSKICKRSRKASEPRKS